MLGSTGTMTPQAFQSKWRVANLKERSAAQEHFLDLCHMLGSPTPAEADPDGEWFTFEKGVSKTTGGKGFADVWRRGRFAWEYKGNHVDLADAYQQLLLYREALENPPLLVVSDLVRFEVHTNFTGTVKRVYTFTIDEIAEPESLRILRAVFNDPDQLKPAKTVEAVTREAAEHFAEIAFHLHERGVEPHRAAHYLVQLLFCLFAEDVGLLPNRIFSKLINLAVQRPEVFPAQAEQLLNAMRDGGIAGYEPIAHFNGGLFAEVNVIPLTKPELNVLSTLARLDWSNIEPAIFGTLFERSLDPARRAQLGAHYTSRADIERVIEPVVMAPLRRRWAEVRAEADVLKAAWENNPGGRQAAANRRREFANKLFAFQTELSHVRVLDPACGSGNFLYVALAALKDLEKEVVSYGSANGLPRMLPAVGPEQLYGLEVNDYAQELTQVVVWIGYLQWMTTNGFSVNRDPVLQSLHTIQLHDSLIDWSDPDHPRQATWPEADFIVGNPPFLGGNKIRQQLGDHYVDALFEVYRDEVPPFADLCCYFYEQAREQIAEGRAKRAGLLATNSIRGGANRKVLERIKQSGDIFMAWSDEPWILDGAAVRISIVGFDDGSETTHTLDGEQASVINPDLTTGADLTRAKILRENLDICFMGPSPKAPFDISAEFAKTMIAAPINVNGRPNTDVVRPVMSSIDLTRRPRGMWTIDFAFMDLDEASQYELPFEYVREHIYPVRSKNRRASYAQRWWQYGEARPGMRNALQGKLRYVVTPAVAKHRVFVWVDQNVLCNQGTLVFARDDDYFFGVLHSKAHELWSLRMGTWLGVGNDPRYTPTTCFETFPFPCPSDSQREAIAEAARKLNERRDAWLNPAGASEADLKKRTLTNLYNQRPTWLAQLHERLDRAVFAAYGWDDLDPAEPNEQTILGRLLELNLERG